MNCGEQITSLIQLTLLTAGAVDDLAVEISILAYISPSNLFNVEIFPKPNRRTQFDPGSRQWWGERAESWYPV